MTKRFKELAHTAGLADFFAPNQAVNARKLELFAELLVDEVLTVNCRTLGNPTGHNLDRMYKTELGLAD